MSIDVDAIVDRRRLRRKLTFWRISAIIIVLVALTGATAVFLPGSLRPVRGDYIARIRIE